MREPPPAPPPDIEFPLQADVLDGSAGSVALALALVSAVKPLVQWPISRSTDTLTHCGCWMGDGLQHRQSLVLRKDSNARYRH